MSAIAAGFTYLDAITLLMTGISQASRTVQPSVAIRTISLAAVSNTLVKVIIVLSTAHKVLQKDILPGVLLIVFAALAATFFVE